MFEDSLPHDAMYDIFEGIVPLEIKCLMSQLIVNGLFTLDELNDRLLNFIFGYSKNDKPVTIFSQCLNSHTNKPLRATEHVSSCSNFIFLNCLQIPETLIPETLFMFIFVKEDH